MSQVNVDTIRKSDGSAGTDIRIKNTSVYESDGGTSVTQNLVQGLAKAWANSSGGGTPVVDDSFNNASITDNGTGDQTFTFTNNMNNANYCCNVGPLENAIIALIQILAQNTTNANIKSHSTSTSTDITGKNYSINGDLA